jgi:hypothetical protein
MVMYKIDGIFNKLLSIVVHTLLFIPRRVKITQ